MLKGISIFHAAIHIGFLDRLNPWRIKSLKKFARVWLAIIVPDYTLPEAKRVRRVGEPWKVLMH